MKILDLKAHFHKFEGWLDTWPSTVLTVILLALGILAILIALFGNSMSKVILTTYFLFP